MGGQSTWNLRGASTNEYVVNPRLEKDIYYESEYPTLFGRINENREVKVIEIVRGDSKLKIDAGNDSPVWEKDFAEGTGECRFTLIEEKIGQATYGSADVKAGNFDQFKHAVCYTIQTDSPAYPLVDQESQFRIHDVISDLIAVNKGGISRWRQKEIELDAFRAIFEGASRGVLSSSDGAMGITLPGATAGQPRSCYNTFVEYGGTEDSLTTPSYTRSTHEGNLATLLNGMSDNARYAFDYESHVRSSYIVQKLGFKPPKIGGREYRAVAITDPRNAYRMGAYGGTLATLMQYAWQRGKDNPALEGMQAYVLDDILYIPSMYMEYFRPTTDGSTVTYGTTGTTDIRSSSFSNTSNITATVYLGAGALLRGRRKRVWFTIDGEGTAGAGHSKGTTYAAHYYDGWMRNEWFTKDGRSAMLNDSSFVQFNFDPGIGKAYAA